MGDSSGVTMRKRRIPRIDRLRISPDVAHRCIDGEYILLDVKRGVYFGLKGVAADIWGALSRKRSRATIREMLLKKYKIDPRRLDRDLAAFVAGLQSKRLVR